MNNDLSNANDPRLRPFGVDVGIQTQSEKKGRSIIVIIVLSGVFAFIICVGAALAIYCKLQNRNHLTEASVMPAKPAGSKTFCLWVILTFVSLCEAPFKRQQCSLVNHFSSQSIS